MLHGAWFHTGASYGRWKINDLKHLIHTSLCKKLINSLFSHQMLLIYQGMCLSLESSLLQENVLIQLLDSQETNAQLMKTLTLRMQPD